MSTDKSVEAAVAQLDELKIVDNDAKEKTEKTRNPRITDEEKRRIWEEKQAQKKVLERGVKGTVSDRFLFFGEKKCLQVKWYSVRRNYGFIAREGDETTDVFVHQSVISKSPINKFFLRTLADGEEVRNVFIVSIVLEI